MRCGQRLNYGRKTKRMAQVSWFMNIVSRTQAFCLGVGITDEAKQMAIREFVLTIAKEQFKDGNQAGIAWARKNAANRAMALGVASVTANQIAQ